MLIINNVT